MKFKRFRSLFIGDKAFYKMVLIIALPIMLQNGITNFVSLLDNIMVGQLGTEQMSGVAIVNQLIMIFYLCIFGALSAASLFASQFYGQGNQEGIKHTFAFKWIASIILSAIMLGIFCAFGDFLISLYLSNETSGNLQATFAAAKQYLAVMLVGLIPYAVAQIYATTLREMEQTMVPMIASSVAVVTNLIFNYFLIFGKFGMPELGVAGAAIATVFSRFVEMGIVVVWTHAHAKVYPFVKGIYHSFRIPVDLVWEILKRGTPLLVNELLFSIGHATLVQAYSVRGLEVVAAQNITATITSLFNVIYAAIGVAIGIVVGPLLGAGKLEEAVETNRKMIFFSVSCCLVIGSSMALLAPLFPMAYNTTMYVRDLAAGLIRVAGIFMPIAAFYHATYFTLRTGGKTIITFLFDGCFLMAVSVPIAFVLVRFTTLPVLIVYIAVQSAELIKAVVGFVLIKKRIWVNNIVSDL